MNGKTKWDSIFHTAELNMAAAQFNEKRYSTRQALWDALTPEQRLSITTFIRQHPPGLRDEGEYGDIARTVKAEEDRKAADIQRMIQIGFQLAEVHLGDNDALGTLANEFHVLLANHRAEKLGIGKQHEVEVRRDETGAYYIDHLGNVIRLEPDYFKNISDVNAVVESINKQKHQHQP